ncbi:hypothetical protein VP01_1636g1 [Puccinia sorghi]|uniref:Uncharacterized protein n=1 Tax=Puccinia sorghi TaxID=27349 RepID=A0A0L6VIM8_9BASI|nr:hypothetical protein VP01_1636g1 [Puccinia sorghi]
MVPVCLMTEWLPRMTRGHKHPQPEGGIEWGLQKAPNSGSGQTTPVCLSDLHFRSHFSKNNCIRLLFASQKLCKKNKSIFELQESKLQCLNPRDVGRIITTRGELWGLHHPNSKLVGDLATKTRKSAIQNPPVPPKCTTGNPNIPEDPPNHQAIPKKPLKTPKTNKKPLLTLSNHQSTQPKLSETSQNHQNGLPNVSEPSKAPNSTPMSPQKQSPNNPQTHLRIHQKKLKMKKIKENKLKMKIILLLKTPATLRAPTRDPQATNKFIRNILSPINTINHKINNFNYRMVITNKSFSKLKKSPENHLKIIKEFQPLPMVFFDPEILKTSIKEFSWAHDYAIFLKRSFAEKICISIIFIFYFSINSMLIIFPLLKPNANNISHSHFLNTQKNNLLNCLQFTCRMLQPSCHPESTCLHISFLGLSACQLQAFEWQLQGLAAGLGGPKNKGNCFQSCSEMCRLKGGSGVERKPVSVGDWVFFSDVYQVLFGFTAENCWIDCECSAFDDLEV